MKKILASISLFFLLQIVVGQNANLSVAQIDSIVQHTDSVAVRSAIEDFALWKKGHKKKTTGGGANWYYTDTASSVLLKVVCEISAGAQTLESYYFYKDSLIYVSVLSDGADKENKIINWSRKCYFMKDQLLLKQDKTSLPFYPDKYLETARTFFSVNAAWKKLLK